jgi:hypothetical protein
MKIVVLAAVALRFLQIIIMIDLRHLLAKWATKARTS